MFKTIHRRTGPVKLKRMFLALMILSIITILCTEIYFTNSHSYLTITPGYMLQKTYMSAECKDKRLGNAMFIYASLIGIAKKTGVNVVMRKDFRLLDLFKLTTDLTSDVERMVPSHVSYEEFGRRASAYDIRTEHLQKKHTILKGYFQSFKYFVNASADVAREFQFHDQITKEAKDFLNRNIPEGWTNEKFVRIGIHVRRGDIIEEYYKNYGYTTPGLPYYEHAMKYFKERYNNQSVQFVVCSDGISWAKENIKGKDIIYSDGHRDIVDMAILSMCDHVIISVGSFGWWAAWLANGTTIYYRNWPKEYSKLEYHIDKKSYFPPSWIPME